MRRPILSIIILIFLFISACEKKLDIEAEKAAIIAVIENESNFSLARDFAKQSESFLQDESMVFLAASDNDFWFITGWEEIKAGYQFYYENDPKPIESHFTFSNYEIKVYENSAFALYDEIAHDREGKFLRKNISIRFLEKVKGEWKILYLGFVNATSFENQ